MLYRAERWAEARQIARTLATEQPEHLWYLGLMGTSAARMGDTATARAIGAQIAEMPWQEHEYEHFLVRARVAALVGEPDEAMRLLRQAISHGRPFGLELHRDMDLESLRQREDYKELMRPKG